MAYRIATLVGSLRRESINRKFAHALVKLGPGDFQFEFLEIGDLPLYNQDHDADQAPQGVTDQVAAMIRGADRLWVGLAPEGTRKPVPRFKPGFWKIASDAGVPVLPAYFDYPRRVIGIGPLFELGDDLDADIARIQRWYRPWRGRNRDVAQPPGEA
jgi:1-acyl-sn-glycerol-3-phosphate acyltransferase